MRITIVEALCAASLLTLSACNVSNANGNAAADKSAATPASAATGIDGTWKADIDSVQMDQKPDEMLLQAGQYSCKSCVPPITLAADGAFHPVADPYPHEVSVKAIDGHTVMRVSRVGNRQIGDTKMNVSADGNTLTGSFTDSSVANAPPTKGEYTETRVGPAPAGAHPISGQWKPGKLANFNAEALTVVFKTDGDTFHMSSPSGVSYDAKIGGPDVPVKGDISGVTASVKKVGDNVYEETDTRKGKVISVATFSIGADGKMNVVSEDKTNGAKTKWSATRS